MKKVLISVIAMITFALTANAQVFLGGQLGLSTSGGSNEWSNGSTKITTDDLKTTTFTFAPQVGFFLSDNFAVGGYLNFALAKQDNAAIYGYDDASQTTIGLTPFARYYFINSGKLKVAAEGQLGFSYTHRTENSGNVVVSEPKTTTLEFNVRPVAAYSITENIDLEAGLNVFSFGFSHQSVKEESGNITSTDKSNRFNLAGNSNNLLSVGGLTIGFIYKL